MAVTVVGSNFCQLAFILSAQPFNIAHLIKTPSLSCCSFFSVLPSFLFADDHGRERETGSAYLSLLCFLLGCSANQFLSLFADTKINHPHQSISLIIQSVSLLFRHLDDRDYLLNVQCIMSLLLAGSMFSFSQDSSAPIYTANNPTPIGLGTFFTAVVKFKAGLTDDERRRAKRDLSWSDFSTAILICVTYFLFIFCRSFMGPIAPALKEDSSLEYDNGKHGVLLIFVGIAYSCGKLINGPIIDRSNPRYCMFIYIIGSSLSVLGFSYAVQVMEFDKRYYWIVGSCMLNAFFQPGPNSCILSY